MAVVFDNSNSTSTSTGVLTFDLTTLTVSGGSNGALCAIASFDSGTRPTGVTMVWDPGGANQSLTAITGAESTVGRDLKAFGLIAPVSGNKILRCSWTNLNSIVLAGICFTGVDQTGGDTTFSGGNQVSSGGPATTSQITINSAVNDMIVAGFAVTTGGYTGTNGTQFYNASNSQLDCTGNYAVGASPNFIMTASQGANTSYWAVGFNIHAAPSGIIPIEFDTSSSHITKKVTAIAY